MWSLLLVMMWFALLVVVVVCDGVLTEAVSAINIDVEFLLICIVVSNIVHEIDLKATCVLCSHGLGRHLVLEKMLSVHLRIYQVCAYIHIGLDPCISRIGD